MSKSSLYIIIVVLAVLASGFFLLNDYALAPTPAPTPESEPITINGEIDCLPKKATSAITFECAIGLQGEDGNYYALKNLSEYDPLHTFSQTGLQVIVKGTLRKEEIFGSDGNAYDIAGVIEITSIEENTEGQEVTLREDEREGSLLVENIYPDRVTGLNFPEYPIAFVDRGLPITLYVGDTASNGCTITLTLVRIEGETAVFNKKTDFNRPCPRCLAEDTLIGTPSGPVAIQNLQKGDIVWTVNKDGARVRASVLKTSKTAVPITHEVVHVVLADGREIYVSLGHPLGDGRVAGSLSTGDTLDGSKVIVAEKIPYRHDYTYDILPSGETGFYWANGILLDSTLHKQ